MPGQQIEKSKFKFCMSKICGSKRSKNNDYECIPYEQDKQTNEVKSLINQNINRLNHLNKLKKAPAKRNLFNDCVENEKPRFHSTQIDQSSVNFACEFQYIENTKITSTLIQHDTISDDSLESDPSLSQISEESSCFSTSGYSNSFYDSPSTTCSQTRITAFEISSDTTYSDDSESFQTLYPSKDNINDNNDVYICNSAYNAKFKGDISVKYTDRVYLIHANDDFALVKKVSDSQCGYIPVNCLLSFDDFMKKF